MVSTKESILQTGRDLFNQHGTAKVSTNHIAETAGISPGNLYYHFKDKAHIIREIYKQMITEWEKAYDRVEDQNISFRTLQEFIEDNFELLWQYRFFYRETVALLNADRALSRRHTVISKGRFMRQKLLLQKTIQKDLLQFPEADIQLDDHFIGQSPGPQTQTACSTNRLVTSVHSHRLPLFSRRSGFFAYFIWIKSSLEE